VSAADDVSPVSAAEAKTLFTPLAHASVVVVAVSGGPDSTALLMLVARWRKAHKAGPTLMAVTVDHGLRRESADEAREVKRLARRLGVPHRTVRWEGKKPKTALQQAARQARYRLLAAAARAANARHVLTAHTLDDQAETVLMRMSRGSGITGLASMARVSPLPVGGDQAIELVRPLLDIPKARLIATLRRAKIGFAEDASNRDPRFTRTQLRDAMPALARVGVDARVLALLARRLRRVDSALEAAVDAARTAISEAPWPERGPIFLAAKKFARLPEEVALRLLGRAIAHAGDEGPVQLGKLEALYQTLQRGKAGAGSEAFRLRRTLAGALVTLTEHRLMIERAPARRTPDAFSGLTTRKYGRCDTPAGR
jgi:tRNA(Ile)-lysidine synthase